LEIFKSTGKKIQTRTVPIQMLDSTKVGEILSELKLINVIPNDQTDSYWRTHKDDFDEYHKNPKTGIQLYSLDQKIFKNELSPSSTIISDSVILYGYPTISIVIDENDLNDRTNGLMKNALKKGRKWERPAYFSFFNDKNLIFNAGLGVRIHGGCSRKGSSKSFRLYFRKSYGTPHAPGDILSDGRQKNIQRLVLRTNLMGQIPFTNEVAFSIARKIGCRVPFTRVVRFYLNGKDQGLYSLSEHLSQEYLKRNYGHDKFTFIRTKTNDLKTGNRKKFEELISFITQTGAFLNYDAVAEKIDIDNFAKWLISILYCETTDAFQGALLLDETVPMSRWFWINWDMDHSFLDFHHKHREPKSKHQDIFAYLLNSRDIRSILFRRLIEESDVFRTKFCSLFLNTLNHKISSSKIDNILDNYANMAKLFRQEDISYILEINSFLKGRNDVMIDKIKKYCTKQRIYHVTVKGDEFEEFEIDGFPETAGYSGYYLENMKIKIEVPKDFRKLVSHWMINGRPDYNNRSFIELKLEKDTTIEAIHKK
jgi:hypothetical protein